MENPQKFCFRRVKGRVVLGVLGFLFQCFSEIDLEGEDLGPLKNTSKGKLYDEVEKQTDRGTMSNPIRNLGGHRHFGTWFVNISIA